MKKTAILFALVALIILYLFYSSPDNVAINEKGEIKGFINKARAGLQGKVFWEKQFREVRSELQWELSAPQRQAKLEREMDQMLRKVDKSMEEMYREYPDLRLSPVERQAEALRVRADQIEQIELDRFIEKIRLERIAELRKILSLVKAKAD